MVGALIALLAAAAFGTGSVLQKVGAPPVDATGFKRLLRHVFTNPTYLLGTGLDLLGFVLTAVAARQLALFAVEGIVATGVGFTAVLAAWWLKEHLSGLAKLAVVTMIAGLVLLAASAAPETGDTLGLPLWAVALMSAGLLALAIGIDHMPTSPATPYLLAVMAGLSFGAWAAIPRLTTDGPAANAIGATFVLIGLTSYAAGLRRGSAVSVMAVTVASETIMPALCGLAVGDTAREGMALAAIAGFVLAVASAILIAVLDGRTSDVTVAAPDRADPTVRLA